MFETSNKFNKIGSRFPRGTNSNFH